MKKLIEGAELLLDVPKDCRPTGIGPTVRLQHGLVLDDGNCWESPLLIEGAVGSGKTALMREIMDSILAYADRVSDNAVIFCAKPDMLAYARPEDIVLDITSEAAESCWSIFAELEASDRPYLTLREIATALFREAKEKTMQPFFPEAAKDMFYQTCRYFHDFSMRTGTRPSNADLVTFIETTPVLGKDTVPGWMELCGRHPEYFSMVRDYIGNGTEQGMGVLSELRTLISSTLYGSFASNNGTFSAIRALKSGGKRIFLHFDYTNASHSMQWSIIIRIMRATAMMK